jgi:hypothetical protein
MYKLFFALQVIEKLFSIVEKGTRIYNNINNGHNNNSKKYVQKKDIFPPK